MRIVEAVSELGKQGMVLTIGNFDGVHTGHQEILAVAKRTAAERKVELTVMTFEPHPVAILQPEKAPGVLTPLELKKKLLAENGVDSLIVLKDSYELLNLTASEFVEEYLVRKLKPGVVVEGEDFNFGSGRRGSVHTLYNLGREKGFKVVAVESKEIKLSIGQSVRVSSTIIRNLLESGKVGDAAIALGRSYRLVGQITAGRGKGRKLGFPTANMRPGRQIIPAEGVYAGLVGIAENFEAACISREKMPAAFSIGRSQTYGESGPLLIEAHLLEKDIEALAGKYMTMDFVERIRSQQKFETEKELAEQIGKDCQRVKEILAMEKG